MEHQMTIFDYVPKAKTKSWKRITKASLNLKSYWSIHPIKSLKSMPTLVKEMEVAQEQSHDETLQVKG